RYPEIGDPRSPNQPRPRRFPQGLTVLCSEEIRQSRIPLEPPRLYAQDSEPTGPRSSQRRIHRPRADSTISGGPVLGGQVNRRNRTGNPLSPIRQVVQSLSHDRDEW